jgi:L-lactate dehydrogenase complex protein LldG
MKTNEPPSAREQVLHRIRAANEGTSDAATVTTGWSALARDYKRSATQSRAGILSLLEDRLLDYEAKVIRSTPADVVRCVAERLAARGKQRLVVPAGFPAEWLPPGFTFVLDDSMTPTELDQVDGVITSSTVAIAETGTVVLQNVPGQGRRAATLVPDYHLCLVSAGDVVETVPEALARLQATATLSTTFVSGPSATADIEMTRIKGVHGPRCLDVILIVCEME